MNEIRECDPVPEGLAAHEDVEDGELVDADQNEEEIDHGQVDQELPCGRGSRG